MTTSVKLTNRIQRKKRIRSQISGTSIRPRLVVYRSNNGIYAQLIDDTAGKTLASASNLKEKGNNIASATMVGEEIAKKAMEQKIKSCVFDRNGYKYHGRVKALADAARKAGMEF